MRTPGKRLPVALIFALLMTACSSGIKNPQSENIDTPCHIIYDAGSKSTRLYIYVQSDSGWLRHSGPKVGALADPVRAVRGKTMADAERVVTDIVDALEQIRTPGPTNRKGKPTWPGFDWRKNCNVQTASVYATAGMRLAEQKSQADSKALWALLNQRLSQTLDMEVSTRTLSGHEEGLFAWLAIAVRQNDLDFGMAEMGGGSLQVAFPCSECPLARKIRVLGDLVPVYSQSFLGWGQDEAWDKYGDTSACALGAGKVTPSWEKADCFTGMREFERAAFETLDSVELADTKRWLLSDAFRYMKDDDVNRYCRQGDDSGYEPESACFRAIFLQEVLLTLGVPLDSEHSKVDWTLGAVVCAATQCLNPQVP